MQSMYRLQVDAAIHVLERIIGQPKKKSVVDIVLLLLSLQCHIIMAIKLLVKHPLPERGLARVKGQAHFFWLVIVTSCLAA